MRQAVGEGFIQSVPADYFKYARKKTTIIVLLGLFTVLLGLFAINAGSAELSPGQVLLTVKRIAADKGIPDQTLWRPWIGKGIKAQNGAAG